METNSGKLSGRRRIGLLFVVCLLGAGTLYVAQKGTPIPAPEWQPGPFDPPVQYAYIPDDAKCFGGPYPREEETDPSPVTCTDWHLRVHFKSGEGRRELNIPYGVGCGVGNDDDHCISDIPLTDAASEVRLNESELGRIPLEVSRDGHRIAYLSRTSMRFVAWDLPSARRKAVSPPLTAQLLGDLRRLDVSPDGTHVAVSFGGARPRVLVTEFATGKTVTHEGFCLTNGLSRGASRIVALRCSESAEVSAALLKGDGTVIRDDGKAGVLSPDGRSTVEIEEAATEDGDDHLVTRDAATGKVTGKVKLYLLSEPSEATGLAWLSDDEYVIEAETPENKGSFGFYRVNVKSGASHRIRDLGLNPGRTISLGTALIRK